MKVPQPVIDLYTDILAHSFEPNGPRMVVGTTTGKIIVVERDWENNEAFARMERTLPNSTAALGVHWGPSGIFVGARSLLHLYRDVEDEESLPVKFEVAYDVQDVCVPPSAGSSVVFGGCDDCKVRAWDVETQKLIMEFADHKMPVDVCKTNGEFIVSGGQDGNVMVYEASLRTPNPVVSFPLGKSAVTGLDVNDDSTWIAAGSHSSPSIFNIRNSACLPQVQLKSSHKIYTVHFDHSNTLWWGGGGGRIFKSLDFTTVSSEIKAAYGEATIHHVYSITTTRPKRISIAGSSTGILFSENSDFWDGMVHI